MYKDLGNLRVTVLTRVRQSRALGERLGIHTGTCKYNNHRYFVAFGYRSFGTMLGSFFFSLSLSFHVLTVRFIY